MARKKPPSTPFPKDFDPAYFLEQRAFFSFGRTWENLMPQERFQACGFAIRDLLILNAIHTEERYTAAQTKRAYYLSIEYLLGRSLKNNLANLNLLPQAEAIVQKLGISLEDIFELEPDAGLGNGGLGRLAACFIDSLATLDMPGFGYGINYEFGLFRQEIVDGRQVEKPDNWLSNGTPWQIPRPDETCLVRLGGRVAQEWHHGAYRPQWQDYKVLVGLPFDMPIVGYGGKTVNYLRLFAAKASEAFDMDIFNDGDYIKAVERKVVSETVSKVLYPNDEPAIGQRLRLVQEYFLVSCSLQDILRDFGDQDLSLLPQKVAVHLNDTHPALAIPELMRLLLDEAFLPWEEAWEICQAVFSYTNHTLLPEALERWPVSLLEEVLPRHLEIIYQLNFHFLEKVQALYPGNEEKVRSLSLVEEGKEKVVRMAHLSILGSHAVNGVSEVHTQLLTQRVVPDLHELWPEKFMNITNGVTPRRWLLAANPGLSALITDAIGDKWITDLEHLRRLEPLAEDAAFRQAFIHVKAENKKRFTEKLWQRHDLKAWPDGMYDVQIKRIHEYKRQLLFLLHAIDCFLRIIEDDHAPRIRRQFIFSGKAAPGYQRAKDIIYLINQAGAVINAHPIANKWLKVIFVPNYSVTEAEYLIPASDLSEQISTAGFEASGTGNMKFAINGALTMATYDGANIEIQQEVGLENIFIFGNTVESLATLPLAPISFYDRSERIRRILNAFRGELFSPGNPGQFEWVYHSLVNNWDPYFHLADLEEYLYTQEKAEALYQRPKQWARKAILNVARIGKFSSDRSIRQYAKNIWGIESMR